MSNFVDFIVLIVLKQSNKDEISENLRITEFLADIIGRYTRDKIDNNTKRT